MSDYVPRARSYPAHGDANSAEYRKTTHPRKRREGWGTRHFKTTQNLPRLENLLALQRVARSASPQWERRTSSHGRVDQTLGWVQFSDAARARRNGFARVAELFGGLRRISG
jgi:hypothetical protein